MASQSSLIAHSSDNPIAYQLDECVNDPDLVKQCAEAGLVAVLRTPRRLTGVGTSDTSILEYCQEQNLPLLTTDWRMPADQVEILAASNPGIVVVRSDLPQTMRTTVVLHVLGSFKSRFDAWHTLKLSNLIIELWPNGVLLQRVEGSELLALGYFSYEDDAWKDQFVALAN